MKSRIVFVSTLTLIALTLGAAALMGSSGRSSTGPTVDEFREQLARERRAHADALAAARAMRHATFTPNANMAIARSIARNYHGWTGRQWTALKTLWQRESRWSHLARNRSSGAYGIPQALPGMKMRSSGDDWRSNPATQIVWGLRYIKGRYGSPVAALAHSNRNGWY